MDFKGRGNLCRGGSGLRDLVFNDRLTVAILTAIRRAQKFPAVAYVISNRFLDLFDMRATDNLVIDKLSHRPRRLSAPACTAILKCRLRLRPPRPASRCLIPHATTSWPPCTGPLGRAEHFLALPLFGFDVFKRLCSIIEHSQLSITGAASTWFCQSRFTEWETLAERRTGPLWRSMSPAKTRLQSPPA